MRPRTVGAALFLVALFGLQVSQYVCNWANTAAAGDETATINPASSKTDPGQSISQIEALTRLKQSGAMVEMDQYDLGRPAAVLLVGKSATDAALADVARLPDLVEVSVCGQDVTDAGLTHLRNLHQLRRLDLQFTQISNAGLVVLKELPAIEELDLVGSFQITDAGLTHLKSLSALQSLDLTFTRVTDQGVEDLRCAAPSIAVYRRYGIPHIAHQTDGTSDDRAIPPKAKRLIRFCRHLQLATARETEKPADWSALAVGLDGVLQVFPEEVLHWERLNWCLGYRAADSFKDTHDRYWWMRQGLLTLLASAQKNPTSGQLLFDIGWTVSQRIGRGEDAKQLRQLFADDTELLSLLLAGVRREDVLGPSDKPDNWLVAKQWFRRAEPLLEREHAIEQARKSPAIFYSSAPMCQIQYAMNVEKEGSFGETALRAWTTAEDEWREYGNKDIPTSFKDQITQKPVVIRLNDKEMHQQAAEEIAARLDAIQPGIRAEMLAEKRAALLPAQRDALNKAPEDRKGKEVQLADQAEESLKLTLLSVASRVVGPKRHQAKKLAEEADAREQMALCISRYRLIVNFDCWKARCHAEQLPSTLLARRLLFAANEELRKGRLNSNSDDEPGAKQLFEQGFLAWKESFAACPGIQDDEELGKELVGEIMLYRQKVLEDGPLPEDFAIKELVDRSNQRAAGQDKE